MPTIYRNQTKQNRMNATVTDIGANGKIKFLDSADVLLVTFTLAAVPATVSGTGVMTFADNNGASAGILTANASAAGTASKAEITNEADDVIISGLTVATSAADFILNNPVLVLNQEVVVQSASITHA